MSYEVKGILLEAMKTLLNGITVDGDSITYFADFFGEVEEGIYLESIQIESDNSKHWFGNNVFISINTFSKGQGIDRTTAITREVMRTLRASVTSTIQLSGGWQATYTNIPSVSSFHESEGGVSVHRDVIRLQVRVDERSNNS